MSSHRLLLVGASLVLASCDSNNTEALPDPGDDVPQIIEIGEMQVLTTDELAEMQGLPAQGIDPAEWCKETDDEGRVRCFFGQLASTDASFRGGATFTYEGTGGEVCVIVDPETVFWNHSVATSSPEQNYRVPDQVSDDGDIDLFSGLSSYYTGSPGVEIGDFQGFYTDSQGREVAIEYGACFQAGGRIGFNTAHAGRATAEFCTVNTDQREGIEYTAVLETWSVPYDDGAVSFASVVVEGSCRDAAISANECTIKTEARDVDGNFRACTDRLEQAYCDEDLTAFCCANPEMCGENEDPLVTCAEAYGLDSNDEPIGRDEWCRDSSTAGCCEGNGGTEGTE